jgi:multidrug efflux pump subunit AcrA (membrane-fusion protein)
MKRFAVLLALVVGAPTLLAHEGHSHEPGKPVFMDVESGGSLYRIGLAYLPSEPVVGEDVKFEVRVVELAAVNSATGTERPLTSQAPVLQITSGDRKTTITPTMVATTPPGTSRTRVTFERAGAYVVNVTADANGNKLTATFPFPVAAGPIWRTTLTLDALVLLFAVAFGVASWRRAAARDVPPVRAVAVAAIGGLAALVVCHTVAGPALGTKFLPARPQVAIDWKVPAGSTADAGTATSEEVQAHETATPAPGSPVTGAADVVATVVPAPGAVADVVVPFAARVLLENGTRLGATVKAGQTLATLEHHYIMHDAVHLINTRYPLMTKMLETKRKMLENELLAFRVRGMVATGALPPWAAQQAETAATEAKLELQRASKLLAMHDAQITQSQLVKRPLQAPISGTIDNVSFVQGQLAYENDRLFTIVDLPNVWVELRIPERVAGAWRPGRHMTFVSPALPDSRVNGTLARVANQVDPDSRTIAYFYQVRNPGNRLRAGMRLSPATEDRLTRNMDDVARASFKPASVTTFAAAGTIRPKPELIAQAAAPIWGRIEYAERRLNVGDVVKKDEVLANVTLELSIDERYLMEARAAEIDGELDLSKARKSQAEQQHKDAVERLKANPDDKLRVQEVELTDKVRRGATEEESLMTRQRTAFEGVMKRRDPRITPVPAPIGGYITEVGFRPGELNETGQFRRLFTIVDTSRVWIEAQVFEHHSALVPGRIKRVMFIPADGGPEIPLGRPVTVSATVDPQTRTVRAIFETQNPGGRLKLGGTGQVVFEWN